MKWVDLAAQNFHHLSKPDEQAFNNALTVLNAHLRLRTYIVGYSRTLADIIVWGCLKSMIYFEYFICNSFISFLFNRQ